MYLYFMTNPLTNISGVYKIGEKQISFDTGYTPDAVKAIIEKFAKAGKAYRMGEYIILPSWPKHQKWETKDSIRQGIIKELNNLSDDELRYVYLSGYKFPLDELLAQRGVDPPAIPPPSMVGHTYSILSNSILSNINLNSSGSAERKETEASPPGEVKNSSFPQNPQNPKKPPLRGREPINDMERVEKAYLLNWDSLFTQGRVKTSDPVVNWNQTRSLLKKHFEKLKPDQIIQALKNGMADDFVLNGGYSLGTMLSAAVLNRLINSAGKASGVPPPSLKDKKSLKGLTSWT
jgi:hypothetical protein